MSVRDNILAGLRAAEADSIGDETPEELLDAYRDEVLAEEASRPVRLRKTGFMAVHPHGAGLMVESFVLDGNDFKRHPVDVAEDAAQLTDVIARHFARLAEQAAADLWPNHHKHCYIREGHHCSCGGVR